MTEYDDSRVHGTDYHAKRVQGVDIGRLQSAADDFELKQLVDAIDPHMRDSLMMIHRNGHLVLGTRVYRALERARDEERAKREALRLQKLQGSDFYESAEVRARRTHRELVERLRRAAADQDPEKLTKLVEPLSSKICDRLLSLGIERLGRRVYLALEQRRRDAGKTEHGK